MIDPDTLLDEPVSLTAAFDFSTVHWTGFGARLPFSGTSSRLGTTLLDVTGGGLVLAMSTRMVMSISRKQVVGHLLPRMVSATLTSSVKTSSQLEVFRRAI